MSDIGCSCSLYITDSPPDFYIAKTRKAKKEHTCCECGSIIKPGSNYEHVSGKWDGSVDIYKTCLLCVRIRNDLFSPTWVHGCLRSDIWDCLGLDYLTGETIDDEKSMDPKRDDRAVPHHQV